MRAASRTFHCQLSAQPLFAMMHKKVVSFFAAVENQAVPKPFGVRRPVSDFVDQEGVEQEAITGADIA